MENLWGAGIVVFLFLIYSKLRSFEKHTDTDMIDKIQEELIDKLLHKIENIEGHLIDIDGSIKDISSDLSDLVGKANFKWGFSEHYPGEKEIT